MPKIDLETAAKIRTVLELARIRGVDPVQVLDRAGFLRHRASIIADRIQLLTAVIESWRAAPADQSKLPKTALDLKNHFIATLEDARDKVIKDGNTAQH